MALWLAGMSAVLADEVLVARGEYLVKAGACASCHTNVPDRGAWLAGGRELPTPYGTFIAPNITPDRETGIGGWSLDQFVAAMREGVGPDGSLYFPIFPYRWYRNLTRDDLAAMKAYLDSLPPVRSEDPPHELLLGLPPGLLRPFVLPWQWINMEDESIPPARGLLAERGWYLVNALGHCGACHTPALPGYIYEEDRFLGGHEDIPGVYAASNITPDPETGIGRWSDADIVRAMAIGIRPDGMPVRGPMADYVAEGSANLVPEDHEAMVAYLRQVPPVRHAIYEGETPRAQLEPEHEAPTGGAPLRADLELGRRLAAGGTGPPEHACVACHERERPSGMVTGMPRLDGQPAAYLEAQLRAYADGTRWSPVMSPIATGLGQPERVAVAAHYAAQPSPKVPPLPDGIATDRGRQLALEGDPGRMLPACIACHGTQGIGIPPAFPYLAGQDPLYMTMQIRLWRHGNRRNDLLGAMAAVARRLSPADAEAVSLWFARLAESQPPSSRATASGTTSPANGLRTVTPASDEPSAISSESKVVQPARASVPSSSASQ
jgi:cytochrome c553